MPGLYSVGHARGQLWIAWTFCRLYSNNYNSTWRMRAQLVPLQLILRAYTPHPHPTPSDKICIIRTLEDPRTLAGEESISITVTQGLAGVHPVCTVYRLRHRAQGPGWINDVYAQKPCVCFFPTREMAFIKEECVIRLCAFNAWFTPSKPF